MDTLIYSGFTANGLTDGATIIWTSSEPDAVSETGAVTRSEENVKVELTAEITYNGETVTETFEVTVRKSA
ncbi:MAG: hypothetical protein LUI14_15360 [Lachnospiraceae bacterium]|nr:hypothetical protein [Lachnospiraceae bacterium]MCD7766632.1 hypothetical protein [Lachnospiraceae bacterium]